MIIPNIWKNIQAMFQTTNQCIDMGPFPQQFRFHHPSHIIHILSNQKLSHLGIRPSALASVASVASLLDLSLVIRLGTFMLLRLAYDAGLWHRPGRHSGDMYYVWVYAMCMYVYIYIYTSCEESSVSYHMDLILIYIYIYIHMIIIICYYSVTMIISYIMQDASDCKCRFWI